MVGMGATPGSQPCAASQPARVSSSSAGAGLREEPCRPQQPAADARTASEGDAQWALGTSGGARAHKHSGVIRAAARSPETLEAAILVAVGCSLCWGCTFVSDHTPVFGRPVAATIMAGLRTIRAFCDVTTKPPTCSTHQLLVLCCARTPGTGTATTTCPTHQRPSFSPLRDLPAERATMRQGLPAPRLLPYGVAVHSAGTGRCPTVARCTLHRLVSFSGHEAMAAQCSAQLHLRWCST